MDAYLAVTLARRRAELRILWFMMLSFFIKWQLFLHYYHELNTRINLVSPLLLQCESGKEGESSFVEREEIIINFA
jgi:hypothetical protein